MPPSKPRTIIKGRRRVAYNPRAVIRRRGLGRFYNPRPTFVETLDMGDFQMPTTGPYLGQLQVALNSIPQMASYANLYNQARILKVQYLIMPAFTEFAPDTVTTGAVSVSCPRVVYSIQDTAGVIGPVSELDVLTDNGSKIRLLNKPLRISHRPVPQLGETTSIAPGTGAAWVTKKYQWLKTDAVGQGVLHGSVNYAVTQEVSNKVNPQTAWTIYAKITVQLRDPK